MLEEYKNILSKPERKDGRIWYNAHFASLSELYDFLESDPPINEQVFKQLASQKLGNSGFYGESYQRALEYLIEGYSGELEEFLELIRKLDFIIPEMDLGSRTEPSYIGSRIHIPNALAGSPKYMRRLVREEEKKFVNIYFNLAYPHYTSEPEIRNRGILTINLIKMLEKNNYRVHFKTFQLVTNYNEVCYIEIILKQFGYDLNEERCYYPLCRKEFLRRILFRVMESMAFKENWEDGYGSNISIHEAKSLLELNSDDILIGYPDNMGIHGKSLAKDASNLFEKIHLEKYIEIDKEKIKRLTL